MKSVSEMMAERPEGFARKNDIGGVQKSFWSGLQAKGFTGCAAGELSWALIRSARPKMPKHAECLRELSDTPAKDIQFLLSLVQKLAKNQANADNPVRAELCHDVACVLQGLLGRQTPANPMTISGVAAAAPGACSLCGSAEEHGPHPEMSQEEKVAVYKRQDALMRAGAPRDQATATAWAER
jgi:hypothetical protein